MRAPIDDAGARGWSIEMRGLAFAIVSGLLGAIIGYECWWMLTRDYEHGHASPGFPWALAGALSTGVLARWVGLRDERPVWRGVPRAAIAGALNAPGMWLVIVALECLAVGSVRPLMVGAIGLAVLVFVAPIGLLLGWAFAFALHPLRRALDRIAGVPTITSVPRAMRATALWSACALAVVLALGERLDVVRAIAIALLCACGIVAAGATWVVHRRRSLASRAERRALDGWRVERDEDGTRWLVREARGGEGAYREVVMSRRWGRL